MNFQNRFGELRSLMFQTNKCIEWSHQLINTAADGYERNPIQYKEKWIPYLQGHSISWPKPLINFQHLDKMRYYMEILPFAFWGIELKGPIINIELPDFLSWGEYLNRISSITLRDYRMDEDICRSLMNAMVRKNLSHLAFINMGLDSVFFHVFGSLTLRHITHLDLRNNNINPYLAKKIAKSEYLEKLKHLDLRNNKIGPEGAKHFASYPNLAQLKTLKLWGNKILDEGAIALASSPYLDQLEYLDLRHNGIGPNGALALANSPFLNEKIRNEWKL